MQTKTNSGVREQPGCLQRRAWRRSVPRRRGVWRGWRPGAASAAQGMMASALSSAPFDPPVWRPTTSRPSRGPGALPRGGWWWAWGLGRWARRGGGGWGLHAEGRWGGQQIHSWRCASPGRRRARRRRRGAGAARSTRNGGRHTRRWQLKGTSSCLHIYAAGPWVQPGSMVLHAAAACMLQCGCKAAAARAPPQQSCTGCSQTVIR